MCIMRLLSPCLFGEGVRVGVRLDMPLYPIHVVVDLVDLHDCVSTVLAQGLCRRIVPAACAWGNFWQVARGRIPRRLGP